MDNLADELWTGALVDVVYALKFEIAFTLVFLVTLTVSGKLTAGDKGGKKATGVDTSLSIDQVKGEAIATQISTLCSSQYGKACDIFSSAQKLESCPNTTYMEMILSLCLASVRVKQPEKISEFLSEIHRQGRKPDEKILGQALKLLLSRKLAQQALDIYSTYRDLFGRPVDAESRQAALHLAVELNMPEFSDEMFEALVADGQVVSRSYATRIRGLLNAHSWVKAKKTLLDMKTAGHTPDITTYNMVLAACAKADEVEELEGVYSEMPVEARDTVSWNTRLKVHAGMKDADTCLRLMREMQERDVPLTQVTYGTTLECCFKQHDMAKVDEVLRLMQERGVAKNQIIHTILIKGLSDMGHIDRALDVFREMTSADTGEKTKGDIILYSVLVKALCDAERMEEAIKVFEQLLQEGHAPDEIVFNNLLTGCVRVKTAPLAEKLLSDMRRYGIEPSAATTSIMVKLYTGLGQFREGENMLIELGNVAPVPGRLLWQHCMAAIRARKGASVLKVFKLLDTDVPQGRTQAAEILRSCHSFNLHDTAVDLVEKYPGAFSEEALQQLEQALAKKKKEPLLQRLARCRS